MMEFTQSIIPQQAEFDYKTCWVHARCAELPGNTGAPHGMLIVTMQKLLMGDSEYVSDIFSDIYTLRSLDGGRTWSAPIKQEGLSLGIDGSGVEHVICDFTPARHRASGRLLGMGVETFYREKQACAPNFSQRSFYSIYSLARGAWDKAQVLPVPKSSDFFAGGTACIQWHELPSGNILVPIYHRSQQDDAYSISVLRYSFDGEELKLLEAGVPITLPIVRGLVEPSLTSCNGLFWLTMRNDEGAYYSTSHDGLNFSAPTPWKFDDGQPLGSANTQQHWALLGEELYLVYTRRGLNNEHVFRHRAPLLIARVDQVRQCVVRDTEQVVVGNRGAGLGNFGVSQGVMRDVWICASEWMENTGRWNEMHWQALEELYPEVDLDQLATSPGRSRICALSGSDNTIHLVKISISK